jgi:hypothetical protein
LHSRWLPILKQFPPIIWNTVYKRKPRQIPRFFFFWAVNSPYCWSTLDNLFCVHPFMQRSWKDDIVWGRQLYEYMRIKVHFCSIGPMSASPSDTRCSSRWVQYSKEKLNQIRWNMGQKVVQLLFSNKAKSTRIFLRITAKLTSLCRHEYRLFASAVDWLVETGACWRSQSLSNLPRNSIRKTMHGRRRVEAATNELLVLVLYCV